MSNDIVNIENLARTIPGVIYRVDLQLGRPIFVSGGVHETCGYQPGEIMSGEVRWLDLVVDEDRPLVIKSIDAGCATAQFSIEYRIRHRSGDIRWILNRANAVLDDGKARWRDGIILDISEEKRTALALSREKKDMANLLSSLDDMVFVIDKEGRFTNYYAKEWQTSMLAPDGCLHKTLAEAFQPLGDLTRLFEQAYHKTVREQSNQKLEYSYAVDGTLRWFRAKFINLPESGTVSLLVRDITKRKDAELALKKREQELELAIKGGDLGTWNWHITSGAISFNEVCVRMIGFQQHEINPNISFLEEVIHPDDKSFVMAALAAHLNGATDFYEAEYRLRHKDGKKWVWVLHHSKIVERDANAKPVRMSGTFLDISARKKAEAANVKLQFKLKEFKAAINEATIVSVSDVKGTIKYANRRFREISQYSSDELVGKKHNIINSGHHPKSFWKQMWKTIGNGNLWRAEVKNKRKDGSYYWVDTFIIPLKNSNGKIYEYLSIRNDITEKMENEIRLHVALEKAKESDRLKSSFLANTSHEIRTPMNAILGFSELLLKDRSAFPEQKRREFIKLIYQRSKDLLGVVNNILDISKIEAGQVTPVFVNGDIRELFDRLASTFREEASHLKNRPLEIRTVANLSPAQHIIRADFLRLKQVLENLVSNAIKFSNNGFIEIGCKEPGREELLFWVRDTGIGIPADKFDVIFLPFHQADENIHQQYGGSGLGLAISKGFVELHGGKIWVESEVGTGSVFYFTMPFTSTHADDVKKNNVCCIDGETGNIPRSLTRTN